MLKDLDIKSFLTTIKTPQDNTLVERLHQVILNMLVTKDISNKAFDYIEPWGKTLAHIAWAIRASCHWTIHATPGQAVFGRDMIFNLLTAVYWKFITSGKERQANIDNPQENSRQATHDYAVGDIVYKAHSTIFFRGSRVLDFTGNLRCTKTQQGTDKER